MFKLIKRWFQSMQCHSTDNVGEHKPVEKPQLELDQEEKSTLFDYPKDEEEADHFHEIIGIIQHTPSGRWLLRHLGREIQKRPIKLRFANGSKMDGYLGYVEDGMIFLERNNINKLPQLQRQKVLLQESCTMMHELEHIWQDSIQEKNDEVSTLPILYHIYLRLLEEAAAYARELFFSEELKIKYPVVTWDMPMLCNWYKSGTNLITRFVNGHKPYRTAEEYIDEILNDLHDTQCIEMNSAAKAEMIKRANHILGTSLCSLKYDDIPLERMRGFKSLKNGYAVKGHHMYLEMDKQGHLALLVDGCHKDVEDRGVCLFEKPKTITPLEKTNITRQAIHDLVKEDISASRGKDVFDKVTWSRAIRGADERVERLLMSKNFERVLDPRYRRRACRDD